MLTTSGIGEYIHDHKTYELTAGKLVFVDSMEYHTHKTSQKSKGCWEVLGFNLTAFLQEDTILNIKQRIFLFWTPDAI